MWEGIRKKLGQKKTKNKKTSLSVFPGSRGRASSPSAKLTTLGEDYPQKKNPAQITNPAQIGFPRPNLSPSRAPPPDPAPHAAPRPRPACSAARRPLRPAQPRAVCRPDPAPRPAQPHAQQLADPDPAPRAALTPRRAPRPARPRVHSSPAPRVASRHGTDPAPPSHARSRAAQPRSPSLHKDFVPVSPCTLAVAGAQRSSTKPTPSSPTTTG